MTKRIVKPRRRMAAKPLRRWLLITVTMLSRDELFRGMEIATTFEERHGDHPPMYFSLDTGTNSILIVVLTNQSVVALRKHFRRLGAFKIAFNDYNTGCWEFCHAFAVAKHLDGKSPSAVMETLHSIHSMCGYTPAQEAANYLQLATELVGKTVVRPNEYEKR